MAAQCRNEGFHVLDEFVCEAIHAPSVPLADPANQGHNEGMCVVEELLLQVGATDGPRPSLPDPLNNAIKPVVEQLATLISASADPRKVFAQVQELLVAELGLKQL